VPWAGGYFFWGMPCSLGSTLDETLGILRHLPLVKEGHRKGIG